MKLQIDIETLMMTLLLTTLLSGCVSARSPFALHKERLIACSEAIYEEILGEPSVSFTYSTLKQGCVQVSKAFLEVSELDKAKKLKKILKGDLFTMDFSTIDGMASIQSLSFARKVDRPGEVVDQPITFVP